MAQRREMRVPDLSEIKDIQTLVRELEDAEQLYEEDDAKDQKIIPFRRLKYKSDQRTQINSARLPFGSRALLIGSVIAAAFDAATYALGYGGGALGALTISVVTFGVALPLAVMGMWFKYREYQKLQSDIEVVVEHERTICGNILSNEITNLKRLNKTLELAALEKKIDKQKFTQIVMQVVALESRLQQFQPKDSDTPEMKKFKSDIGVDPYSLAAEVADLELTCTKGYLNHICIDNGWDIDNIKKTHTPPSPAPLPIQKADTPSTLWRYLLGFAYALGTLVTIAFMTGLMAALATIPGGIVVLAGALALAYLYKKLDDKFVALQTNLVAMNKHYDEQRMYKRESDQSINTIEYLCSLKNSPPPLEKKPSSPKPDQQPATPPSLGAFVYSLFFSEPPKESEKEKKLEPPKPQ